MPYSTNNFLQTGRRSYLLGDSASSAMKAECIRLWAIVWLVLTSIFLPVSVRGDIPVGSLESTPGVHRQAPVVWATDIDGAIGRAQVNMQPLLMFFTRSNCPPCEQLKRFSLQSELLQPILRQFECVEIDITRHSEVAAIAQVFQIPALRVVEPSGRVSGRWKGYMTARELGTALLDILADNSDGKQAERLMVALKTGKAPAQVWRKALLAMNDSRIRQPIESLAAGLSPQDRDILVSCLLDDLLAVRLGALELLERLTDEVTDWDPWADQEDADQQAALKRWLASGDTAETSPALTHEGFERYLAGLIGDAPEHWQHALRQLVNGGRPVGDWILAYRNLHPRLDENAQRRLKEVQYALFIPMASGQDPLTLAHQIVWGNPDVQIHTIRQLVDCGKVVVPILTDLLTSAEAVVRETAIDTLFAVAGPQAITPVESHLARESDPDILYIILTHLGEIETPQSRRILETFFKHPNEDLAIAAIEGAVKLPGVSLTPKLLSLLEDPRWRVRVAVLEALKKTGGRDADFVSRLRGRRKIVSQAVSDAICRCLDDADAFVRHTAAVALGELKIDRARGPLKSAYQKHPKMRGVIVSVLLQLESRLPDAYLDDLFKPNPDDLLYVLDHLEEIDTHSRELVHRAVQSENPDIAGSALRIVAHSENRTAADNNALVRALDSGQTEKQLTVLQEFDVDHKETERLVGVLKATPALKAADDAAEGSNEAILFQMVRLMTDLTASALVRTDAMVMLCRYGYAPAFDLATENWAELTTSKRTSIIRSLQNCETNALVLYKKALADTDATVWKQAVRQLAQHKNPIFLKALLDHLLDASSRLRPAMVWPQGLGEACSYKAHEMLPFARRILTGKATPSNEQRILALSIYACGDSVEADREEILSQTIHDDPLVRRAAWIALSHHSENAALANRERIGADPSPYVRGVFPEVLYHHAYIKKFDLYFSEDICFSDYDGLRIRPEKVSFSQPEKQLQQETIDALNAMIATDTHPLVRFRCMLTLLSHHIPYDLNAVVATARATGQAQTIARLTADFFSDQGRKLGRNFQVLLPLLKTPDGKFHGEYEIREFQKRFSHAAPSYDRAPQSSPSAGTQAGQATNMATFVDPYSERTSGAGDFSHIELVFFTTSGCRGCGRAEHLLKKMQRAYPGIRIPRYDIHTRLGLARYEALCNRFEVESVLRAKAPAVFMPHGYLIGDDVTRDLLEALINYANMDSDGTTPLNVTQEELHKASITIQERAKSYGWTLLAADGLAHGKTPGLIASIFLLLLYLFYAGQKGRALLRLGLVYIATVLGVLLLLWLGLQGAVFKHANLDLLTGTLSWLLAISMLLTGLRYFCAPIGYWRKRKKKKSKTEKNRRPPSERRVLSVVVLWAIVVAVLNIGAAGNAHTLAVAYLLKRFSAPFFAGAMLLIYAIGFTLVPTTLFFTTAVATDSAWLQSFWMRHAVILKFLLSFVWFALCVTFVQ